MENEEKFLIFTTDSACFEFVPEAEADTAEGAFHAYLKLQHENKYANYLIKFPDGVVRTANDLVENIHPPKKLHEEIPGDTVIWRFDGVGAATVYRGWLTGLEPANVKWKTTNISIWTANATDGEPEFITLDELAEQFPGERLTVIIDKPLCGEILNYGNAGRKWLRIGITGGYA